MAEAKTTQKKPRTRGDLTANVPKPSDIKVTGVDPDNFGPSAFAAQPVGDITGYADSQEFILDDERVAVLHFTKPGQSLEKKRSYTVKAIKPDGTLVQLPFEPQINNTVAGAREDAIGLHRAEHKGFKVLYDYQAQHPVYCATWGCWAQSRDGNDFCSDGHQSYTQPEERESAYGATTSSVWQS